MLRMCLLALCLCLTQQAWAGSMQAMPEQVDNTGALPLAAANQAQPAQRWIIKLIEYKVRARAEALVTRLGYKNFSATVAGLGPDRYQVRIVNLSGYDDAVAYRQRLLQKTNILPAHIQITAQPASPKAEPTRPSQSPPESPVATNINSDTPITAVEESDQAKFETVIFHVTVNGEDQGVHYFKQGGKGAIWSTPATLNELGIKGFKALKAHPADEPLSLGSIKQALTYKLDMDNGELTLNVQPKWLPARQMALSEAIQSSSEMLGGTSAFLNYNVSYGWTQQSSATTVAAPLELGMRAGDLFFSANANYSNTNVGRKHWTRTQTQLLWDDPEHLIRVTAGDVFSSTGAAGIGSTLGGITVAREFGIKPYLVLTPETSFNVMVPTLSDVEVYINGNLVKKEKVAPGPLRIGDLPFYGGRSELEVLIRDAFGRETRRTIPYYDSSQLLQPGLSDFSYSLGVPQQNNVLGELTYTGSPALLGYHRLGLTDWLTMGAHTAYQGGRINAGLSADLITGTVGEMNMLLSGSSGGAARGLTGSVNYSLTAWQALSPSLFLRATTPSYRSVFQAAATTTTNTTRWEAGGGLGFNLFDLGTVSGNYRHRWRQDGIREQNISTFYSARLFTDIGLTMSGSWKQDSVTAHTQERYSLGLNYYFSNGISLTLTGNREDGVLSGSMQIQLNTPLAEGFGYSMQTSKSEASKTLNSSARVSWRNRYNELDLSRSGDNKTGSYSASGTGALAFIDGGLYLSRAIQGGFALVQTGGMADVPVSYSNQPVGVTNSKGELLVPDIIAYNDNAIGIDAGNMPMGYQVDATSRDISVPYRSGGVVKFNVQKIQSVEGSLFIRDDKGEKAARYYGLELSQGDTKQTAIVGDGGEFYLENMHAGLYKARLFNEQRECRFDMRIPKRESMFIKMGKIVCAIEAGDKHD